MILKGRVEGLVYQRTLARATDSSNTSKSAQRNTQIDILQISLDFDKTPEIAKNLFQIYEFCRVQIIEALLKKTISGLNKAIFALEDILDGWKEIKPESL